MEPVLRATSASAVAVAVRDESAGRGRSLGLEIWAPQSETRACSRRRGGASRGEPGELPLPVDRARSSASGLIEPRKCWLRVLVLRSVRLVEPVSAARSIVFEMTPRSQRVGWVGGWDRRHYKPTIVVRALLARWILFLTVFLCAKGHWWALVFLPFLALDLWLLRNLVRYARSQRR